MAAKVRSRLWVVVEVERPLWVAFSSLFLCFLCLSVA